MSRSVLITGGAGFIGSHLADELLRNGYSVRVLDNLAPQVHGPQRLRPAYLDPEVELIRGDVLDPEIVVKALRGVTRVFHLAAMVGVGQSMYEIERYTAVNNVGTAVLLEAVVAAKTVEKLVVASSMSIYGEGSYVDSSGRHCTGIRRTLDQLRRADWEVREEKGEPLIPVPTTETKTPDLSSVYALSKYDQERMSLMVGAAYGIPTTALRFFNVYGTRQSLSNPYTGVLAIFASRLLNGNPPRIFEDGLQLRDFVSVHDVAAACRLAMEVPESDGKVFNIGSGERFTVRSISEKMSRLLGKPVPPEIIGSYRVGDIRHCFADISEAKRVLGYTPGVDFEEGLSELAGWLEGQIPRDMVAEAHAELAARGLTV
jgi:dTDP-L-rhamnose 4-epimerase